MFWYLNKLLLTYLFWWYCSSVDFRWSFCIMPVQVIQPNTNGIHSQYITFILFINFPEFSFNWFIVQEFVEHLRADVISLPSGSAMSVWTQANRRRAYILGEMQLLRHVAVFQIIDESMIEILDSNKKFGLSDIEIDIEK